MSKKGKITGIGGVFFKCKDPNAMRTWYHENFGLSEDKYGILFYGKNLKILQKMVIVSGTLLMTTVTILSPLNKNI